MFRKRLCSDPRTRTHDDR